MAMWKTRRRALPGAGRSMARTRATYGSGATQRLLRGSHGSGLVEFALVLPLLLSLVFGIFEFGRLGLSQLTARHAVAEAAPVQVRDGGYTEIPAGTRTAVAWWAEPF